MNNNYIELIVIGKKTKKSRRKKIVLPANTNNYITVLTMKLYSGHLWGVLPDGKRRHIKEIK